MEANSYFQTPSQRPRILVLYFTVIYTWVIEISSQLFSELLETEYNLKSQLFAVDEPHARTSIVLGSHNLRLVTSQPTETPCIQIELLIQFVGLFFSPEILKFSYSNCYG
jgi:hypothetical protein